MSRVSSSKLNCNGIIGYSSFRSTVDKGATLCIDASLCVVLVAVSREHGGRETHRKGKIWNGRRPINVVLGHTMSGAPDVPPCFCKLTYYFKGT